MSEDFPTPQPPTSDESNAAPSDQDSSQGSSQENSSGSLPEDSWQEEMADDPWGDPVEPPSSPAGAPKGPARTPSQRSSRASARSGSTSRSRPKSTPSSRTTPRQAPAPKSSQPSIWESSVSQAAAFVVRWMQGDRPQLSQFQTKLKPVLSQIGTVWGRAIAQLRLIVPEAWTAKLSDQVLGGIVVGVLLVGLWLFSSLLSLGGDRPATVSNSSREVPAMPSMSTPAPQLTLPTTAPFQLPEASTDSPPLPLNLPPEQSLIAAIQEQVADITGEYEEGLIQSIQANFRTSLLTVAVGADWYALSEPQQDQLANDLLKRSHDLEFSRLILTNELGEVLARSPVVGDRMVVLVRMAQETSS